MTKEGSGILSDRGHLRWPGRSPTNGGVPVPARPPGDLVVEDLGDVAAGAEQIMDLGADGVSGRYA